MQTKKEGAQTEKTQKLKLYTITVFSFIIIILSISISSLTVLKTDDVLSEKVSALTSELAIQMNMNINRYLSTLETTAALVFAYENIYTYDATNQDMDEFEALNMESAISKELLDICVMENYLDFFIVYSNNHMIGKFSNGTQELFETNLYTDLSAAITNERTQDGWITGYYGDYKRIYYVKRLHENAILVNSVYTFELADVFEHPNNVGDITVRLTDSNYTIMYSSFKEDTIGTILPNSILKRVRDKEDITSIDSAYLVTINKCNNDWYVICSTPTSDILKERKEMLAYIIFISVIAAIIACSAGVVFAVKMADSVQDTVTTLDRKSQTDLLTGILNKKTFEEFTISNLSAMNENSCYALIIIDVDNFKEVNDKYGHACGDDVLSKMGHVLQTMFCGNETIGRIGGDEFCVLTYADNISPESFLADIEEKCSNIKEFFHTHSFGDSRNCHVTVSIGVTFAQIPGYTFDVLYRASDEALYKSKRNGKDTYVICHMDGSQCN